MIGLGLAIWAWDIVLNRRPESVPKWGWQLLAIFLPTILGLMLRPMSGGAVVLIALTVAILTGTLTTEEALGGFADKSVWLVLAAYFISRAVIKTGLARRIALGFVRRLGGNTLGLSYALVATDTVLAGMIPSNAARVGGVVLPIARSLAELYRSFPGRSAALLGTFLLLALYQADVANCAMFLTGQASNPIAASAARKATAGVVDLHYGNWLLYACVPAVASIVIVPYLTYRWTKPEIRHTPEAVDMARRELEAMGPMRWGERIVLGVFVGVCLGWIYDGFANEGKNVTAIAFAGVGVLLLSGVLTWEDAVSERAAWDVFIWYGGLVQLGKMLGETTIPEAFATSVAGALDLPMIVLFLAILLIYFYAHYAFASITAHIVSMYPAFVAVLMLAGVPPALAACSFAFVTNLSAGLTHYGTTPGPIIFNTNYVPMETWWRVGFLLSVVNLVIWLTLGLAWWKVLGLW
ncbi:MAG: anion permease [Gemmataceae bacterium]|nr:anion permease [Gemmataceae bacterium]MCI0740312.1 anion permease [Gemmataceae bacterium]